MKLPLRNIKSFFDDEEVQVLKEFVLFIQKQLPLSKEVNIEFSDSRPHNMTTGLRIPNRIIILARKRLLSDIIRTIAHEWVHEYQHQKLGLSEKEKVQNIGGPEENLANIVSGIMFKKFEGENPNFKKVIYGEN